MLDGRQLALKVSANSVYGFTGEGGFGCVCKMRVCVSDACVYVRVCIRV